MEYDPILAKLIVYAETRKDCISRMIRALNEYVILGIMTPIPFLVDILKTQAFQDGETYTDFIDKHFADWGPTLAGKDLAAVAFIVDALSNRRRAVTVTTADAEANSPWKTLGNFRP